MNKKQELWYLASIENLEYHLYKHQDLVKELQKEIASLRQENNLLKYYLDGDIG